MFLSGVVILSISNIVIKIVGMLFKIPLAGIIGNSGMGYFNSAYTIYVWFYMISTAGLPVAVSIMISEARALGNFKEVRRIFRVTLYHHRRHRHRRHGLRLRGICRAHR